MEWPPAKPDHDLVIIENLSINANIGLDCWKRIKAQPILISLELEANLSSAGQRDDLTDSINYGDLQKDLVLYFLENPPRSFPGMAKLAEEIAKVAIPKTQSLFNVKVALTAPKLLLQDAKLTLEIDRAGAGDCGWGQRWKWIVSNWRTYVLVGMNPPERKAKQVLVLDLQIFDNSQTADCTMPELMSHLSKWVETTAFLTLEKFATELIWTAMRLHSGICTMIVKVNKPSATLYADAAAIQIRRDRPQEGDSHRSVDHTQMAPVPNSNGDVYLGLCVDSKILL